MIYILAVISLLVLSVQNRHCYQNLPFYITEEDVQKETDELIQNSKSQPIGEECLQFLIQRGFQDQAIQLYESYFFLLEDKVTKDRLNDGVRIVHQQIKRNYDFFMTHFHSSSQQIQIVQPAIQWAQSNSSIFIHGKLGLRVDSPACLTCKVLQIDLKENYLNYTSFGIYSHMPVQFNLYLEFEQPIDVEASIIRKEAVVEDGIWRKPASNLNKKVPIWWDMREKHKTIMDKWSQMLEEDIYQNEKQQKEKKEIIKRREKKEKRIKEKGKNGKEKKLE